MSLEDKLRAWFEHHKIPIAAVLNTDEYSDWRNDAGLRPLHVACLEEDRDATLRLLVRGHSLDDELPQHCHLTPFMLAVARCDLDFCQWLLKEVSRMSWCNHRARPLHLRRSSNGATPLMFAVAESRLSVAKWLVEISGVESLSHAQYDTGRTVAMHAAMDGDFETVQWVLSTASSVDVTKLDKSGTSILSYAACNKDVRVIEWICKDMYDKFRLRLTSVGDVTSNAVMHAIAYERLHVLDYVARQLGQYFVVDVLIDHIPALFFAALRGRLEVLKWHHERWPHVFTTTSHTDGTTVLTWAASSGSIEMMAWLCDTCDVNPTGPSYQKSWALVGAASKGHRLAVEWLLQRGCSFADGGVAYNVLSSVSTNGHIDLLKWLDQTHADCHDVILRRGKKLALCAAMSGHLAILQWYHEKNAFAAKKALDLVKCAGGDDHLDVVIWLDAQFKCGEAYAEYLMEGKQFEVFLQQGRPPMRVVDWLLSNGFVSKHDQQVCLFLAAKKGNIDVVKCFHRHGLSLDVRNETGKTLLMNAAVGGNLETVR